MYKDKNRCLDCKYGYLPVSMYTFFEGKPACLYFHDTGKHRDGDDEICNSYQKLTSEDIKERQREGLRKYHSINKKIYY